MTVISEMTVTFEAEWVQKSIISVMSEPIRWTVQDRSGNNIYLTQERWEHIIESINHPEMEDYEEERKETVTTGSRKQDSLNPQK